MTEIDFFNKFIFKSLIFLLVKFYVRLRNVQYLKMDHYLISPTPILKLIL
jgi:hypothetical protein